jgi:hypothetical protein
MGSECYTVTTISSRRENNAKGDSATPYSWKKGTLRLATRTRLSDKLRSRVSHARNPNSKGKLLVDHTGDPAGPPKILGSRLACSWGLALVRLTTHMASF